MPQNYEAKRLQALVGLEILDTSPEPEFDCITTGAQHLFGCKIALVSLITADRQWFKAKRGIELGETSRDISFCAHAVDANDMLIVPDARFDPRFSSNPLVVGPPHIRMYVGVPLRVPDEGGVLVPIGTLCVIDNEPGQPAADKVEQLQAMARVLEVICQLRRSSRDSLKLALERNEAVLAVDRVRKQLQQAERMAQIGSWRLELATSEISWSDEMYVIHGLVADDRPSLGNALSYYPAEDRARIDAAVTACSQEGTAYDLELDFINAKAELRRVRALGEAELKDGHAIAIIGVFQDITERHRTEQTLSALARTDELTQLASRRWLNERLDLMIEEARASGQGLAVALLDLDHFKNVNDRYGHAAGDEVLRTLAAKLKAAPYLINHFAARLGGDEFVLVLRGHDADAGFEQGLLRLSEEMRLSIGTGIARVDVSVTIGAARLGDGTRTRSALLAAADAALYAAKRAKRGTVQFAASPARGAPPGTQPL